MLDITPFNVILVLTVGLGVTCGLLAWRERPEPGALPLVFLLAGQVWWSATLIFRIDATTVAAKAFWVNVSWVGIALIPVAWLLFSLDYRGYDEYTTPKYVVVASIVPAVTIALALTDGSHSLLYTSAELVEQGGSTTLVRSPGPWFWIIAGYTYLLGFLGAFPLFNLVRSEVYSFRGQSLALLVGLLAPWLTNLLYLFGRIPTGGVDPTPVAFAVSGVAYLGALTQFKLLGANPTPIRKARQSLFQKMHQGALVLDAHDIVVDMNDHAANALATTQKKALGSSLGQVSPKLNAISEAPHNRRSVFSHSETGRSFDVSESSVTDIHGRTVGRVITLHEVSDLLRMQQRLEVLHRAFRHNIQTNLQVIIGMAEYLGSHNDEQKAQTLIDNATEIEATGEKVRAIMNLFERSRQARRTMTLDGMLDQVVETYAREHPDVTFEYDGCERTVVVDTLFEIVCSNLVENAAKHNTAAAPEVTITVEARASSAVVRIADNGPGIEPNELALHEEGTETPLNHGSGFGLALAIWGTDIAGGDIQFQAESGQGTEVSLTVPDLSDT